MFDYTVSVSCELNTNQEKVWDKISTPGIVNHYHPFCMENPVLNWNAEESVDEIIYENNLVYRREFTAWYDGVGYDLMIIHNINKRKLADVIWRVAEIEDEICEFRITIKSRLEGILPRVPRFLRWIAYYVFIHRQMKSYLEHVMRGFEIYMSTEVQVKPNQFGSHRFFSKR